MQPRSHASEDALNFPVRLNNILAALGAPVGSGDAAPTDQDEAMFADLKSEAASAFARWRELKTGEVAAFEKLSMLVNTYQNEGAVRPLRESIVLD